MATKYKCGKCGKKGHNKATCSSKKKKKKIRRKTKGGRGRNARRKCSKCSRVGHNKATCGSKKKTKKAKKKTRSGKKVKKKAKKKKTRMSMTPRGITKRWGKVVARHKSKSSNKKYEVRRKGRSYSCNCPGWTFKKKGKPRNCRHVTAARSAGKRRNYSRSRFCRR